MIAKTGLKAAITGVLYSTALLIASPNHAHGYREKGKPVSVAKSRLEVTPPQDWNRLDRRPGKNAETWTLDGERLNEVTFYGGIATGKPLVKEHDRKHAPLPKVSREMLLIDIPGLLEGTYRVSKKIAAFKLTSTEPGSFLGKDGVHFTYEYVGAEDLTRMGEARATLINGKLYMVTFDAPRLHYFARGLNAWRALVETAVLP